jgi:hypothetical protein
MGEQPLTIGIEEGFQIIDADGELKAHIDTLLGRPRRLLILRRGRHRPLGPAGVAADQKGATAESAWLVFFDESAVSLIPPVRRTWSPRGQTPILRHRFGWKKASMAAALGYRPDGSAARLCFHLQQPATTPTPSSASWTSSGRSIAVSGWC